MSAYCLCKDAGVRAVQLGRISSSVTALDFLLRPEATAIEPTNAARMMNLTIMFPVLRWAGAVAGAKPLQEVCKQVCNKHATPAAVPRPTSKIAT